MSALTLATIGSLYVQKSPLSATQLLWLNLLMDSLASLALATEPPNEAQLKRPPVNRTSSIITPRMWYNMLGQAAYQVVVVLVLMFQGQHLAMDELDDAGVEDGVEFLEVTHTYSRQYTIIFNTYVLMQLFNEVNCRKLLGEKWVFSGMTENKYFVRIWASTIVLQVIFAQFGGAVVGCSGRGLNGVQWLFCIAVGCGSIPWQFFVSTIADYALASPGHSAGRFGAARHSLVEQQSAMRRRSSMSQGPKSPGSGSVRSVRGAKLV
jgi:Ca2+ transporting ATPase